MKPPKHIAIIMDGNGRWAKNKSLPRALGHKAGAQAAEKIAKESKRLGVKFLTLYAFSSENWERPSEEVNALMTLFTSYLQGDVQKLIKSGIRISFIGERNRLSASLIKAMEKIEQASAHHSFHLVLAISYSGRDEIRKAAMEMAVSIKNGALLETRDFDQFISTNQLGVPDPDLLIRTSGEYRISNFLLWQMAYTELYFSDKYWPDFDGNDLQEAIVEFNNRERRYGR